MGHVSLTGNDAGPPADRADRPRWWTCRGQRGDERGVRTGRRRVVQLHRLRAERAPKASVSATTAITLAPRLQLLSELRSETGRPFEVYAMFARVAPLARPCHRPSSRSRAPDVRSLTPVGATVAANPLIGTPLPYQYLTSLRPDAVPATTDDLLAMRGRGWRPSYPLGSQSVGPGGPAHLRAQLGHRGPGAPGRRPHAAGRRPHHRHDRQPARARRQRREAACRASVLATVVRSRAGCLGLPRRLRERRGPSRARWNGRRDAGAIGRGRRRRVLAGALVGAGGRARQPLDAARRLPPPSSTSRYRRGA